MLNQLNMQNMQQDYAKLVKAATRYISAVDAWMDNRPDDEQGTYKELIAFTKNEQREHDAALNELQAIIAPQAREVVRGKRKR